MAVCTDRNTFGRQNESFESPLISGSPYFHGFVATFIRGPGIAEIQDLNQVRVLGVVDLPKRLPSFSATSTGTSTGVVAEDDLPVDNDAVDTPQNQTATLKISEPSESANGNMEKQLMKKRFRFTSDERKLIVAARQENILLTCFHPEMAVVQEDTTQRSRLRIHEYFLKEVCQFH